MVETAPGTGAQCILFVTHKWDAAIAAHYERLKREAGSVMDVLLVFQAEAPETAAAARPDLIISTETIRQLFPHRLEQYWPDWWFNCADLVWMTACLSPRLSAYDRFWMVEYDVDFSGDWRNFFQVARDYRGALLGSRLRRLAEDPNWNMVDLFARPDPDGETLIGFFPLVRADRALIEAYRETVETPGWRGHFEMLLPSIAVLKGFEVFEIGGTGPFLPPEREGLHYWSLEMRGNARSTFTYRPARSFHYFVQSPRGFRHPDFLYHPVKTDLSLLEKAAHLWAQFGQYWVPVRNKLLGRTPRPGEG